MRVVERLRTSRAGRLEHPSTHELAQPSVRHRSAGVSDRPATQQRKAQPGGRQGQQDPSPERGQCISSLDHAERTAHLLASGPTSNNEVTHRRREPWRVLQQPWYSPPHSPPMALAALIRGLCLAEHWPQRFGAMWRLWRLERRPLCVHVCVGGETSHHLQDARRGPTGCE